MWAFCGSAGSKQGLQGLTDGLSGDLAKRYKLTKLPTMVILDANGKELNRREGFIGEVEFRRGFLDLTKIEAPPRP